MSKYTDFKKALPWSCHDQVDGLALNLKRKSSNYQIYNFILVPIPFIINDLIRKFFSSTAQVAY